MSNILLIDFGSTYTKVTAVDTEREELLGTAVAYTTVATDITEGLEQSVKALYSQTGTVDFASVLACSSAAGGLRMVAIGLVPELTAEAAKYAALGAGAKVLRVFSGELNEYEINEIAELKPDIILLAGGTDGGNKQVILHNAAMLARIAIDVPIVVAGNKSVVPAVVKELSKNMSEVVHTENVMPRLNDLNIEPARKAIRDIFLKRIIHAKGLDRANRMVHRLVMPTPVAVLKAAELLSVGTSGESGWGDLMVVDIGGATTDVYSIAKGDPVKTSTGLRGLPEPFAKRTVEGDLGMRYSALSLVQAAGSDRIAASAGLNENQLTEYIEKITVQPDYLAQNSEEQRLETAMGQACVRIGADRHVGRLETVYTPTGAVFVQTGKDLTAVRVVVGTGGVIINSQTPKKILSGVLYDQVMPQVLKPEKPEYVIDSHYIMAAMGLLAEEYPEVALRVMKKYLERGRQSWN